MKAINPATNEILKEYPEHTLQEVKKIINQVQEEFHSWRQVSFVQRASLMKKAANILRQKKKNLPC